MASLETGKTFELITNMVVPSILIMIGTAFGNSATATSSFRPSIPPRQQTTNLVMRDDDCTPHQGFVHNVADLMGSIRQACPPPGTGQTQSLEQAACRASGMVGCADAQGAIRVVGSAFVVRIPGSRTNASHIVTASHVLMNQDGSRRTNCMFVPHGRPELGVPIVAASMEPLAGRGSSFGIGDRAIARLGTNEYLTRNRTTVDTITGFIPLQVSVPSQGTGGNQASPRGTKDQPGTNDQGLESLTVGFNGNVNGLGMSIGRVFPFDPEKIPNRVEMYGCIETVRLGVSQEVPC